MNRPTHNHFVIVYYPDWCNNPDISAVANRITHIQYAFVYLDAEGNCTTPQQSTVDYLVGLKKDFPHLKLLYSVGGWVHSTHFSAIAKDPIKRQYAIEQCLELVRSTGFDGIDIDWEHPIVGGDEGCGKDPLDGVNYTQWLKEFREAMLPHEELSIAIAATEWVYKKLPLAEMSKYLTTINTMSYDYNVAASKRALHHTPLYQSPYDPEPNSGDGTIRGYLAEGVPAEKLVLGVAFYGHAWRGVAAGEMHGLGEATVSGFEPSYDEIKALIGKNGFERHWDDISKAPYLYSPSADGGTFIGYDDPESIALKTHYALDNHLCGVMAWEVTQNKVDDDLIEQIDRVLSGRN